MKTESWRKLAYFSTGMLVGCVVGGVAWHADDVRRAPPAASAAPSPSASATHIAGPRVEWCAVSSYPSVINDKDPLGPLPTRWALDGYFASGARKTVDTGDTSEEMVARAKELGCPLRGAL
jgi:hypothetical protein